MSAPTRKHIAIIAGVATALLVLLTIINFFRSTQPAPENHRDPYGRGDAKTSLLPKEGRLTSTKVTEGADKSRLTEETLKVTEKAKAHARVDAMMLEIHDLKYGMAEKVIGLKRKKGAAEALAYVRSIVSSEATSDLERFFSLRLIPYAVSGDAHSEMEGLLLIRQNIARSRDQKSTLGILAALSGVAFKEGYSEGDNGSVVLHLLPSSLDAKSHRRDPTIDPEFAYTWSYRELLGAGADIVTAARIALESSDRYTRMAAIMAAAQAGKDFVDEGLLGRALVDTDEFIRLEGVRAYAQLYPTTRADRILNAATQDSSELVRQEAISNIPQALGDNRIAAAFLVERALSDSHKDVAVRAVEVLFELLKTSTGEDLVPEVNKVFQGYALKSDAHLASFLQGVGETYDTRLLPLLRSGQHLPKSPEAIDAMRLAIDRLQNSDRYRSILRSIDMSQKQLESTRAEMNETGVTPAQMRALNAQERELQDKIHNLRIEYSTPR